MTASVGFTVAHSVDPIFKHIIDGMALNGPDGDFNLVSLGGWRNTYSYGTPQKILQRGQIAAARRPVDIAVSADYAIFERTAQEIDCDVGCVARSAVLLDPYVVYVFLFHSGKEEVFQHAAIWDTINGYGGLLLVFKEKRPSDATRPHTAPNSHSLWMHWLLQDNVWIFLNPKCDCFTY